MSRMSAAVLALSALAAMLAAATPRALAQAMPDGAPPEAFGETSYYDAYPRLNPDDLIDPGLWTTCWAMTQAEKERLQALSDASEEPLKAELHEASLHYQVAEIYYSEIVRGTAIYQGLMTRDTNAALVQEQQALIGGAAQWLASNAADCIYKMPSPEIAEFPELYPWLADALGTAYRN